MAFGDTLLEGSFRGLPFFCEESEADGGKRLAKHEYPARDDGWSEELGRKIRGYTVYAYFLGEDAIEQRARFIAALETPGAAKLVHPYHGERTVQMEDYRAVDSSREGNVTRLSVAFVEAGQNRFPRVTVATGAATRSAATGALAQLADGFTRAFDVANAAHHVIEAAAQNVRRATSEIRYAATRLASSVNVDALAELRRDLARVEAGARARVLDPDQLAESITGLVAATAALVDDPPAVLEAMRTLVRFGEDLEAIPPITANRQRQIAAEAAFVNLVRRSAMIEMARAASNLTWPSRIEALAFRDEYRDLVEAEVAEAGDEHDDEGFDALKTVEASVVRDITQRAAALANVVTFVPETTVPALVVAYRVHGDAARDAEVIARNRIEHPMFLLGGEALELLRA